MFDILKRKFRKQEVPAKRTRIVETKYREDIPPEEREFVKEEKGAFTIAGIRYRRGIFYDSHGYHEEAIADAGPQEGRRLYPGVDYEKIRGGIRPMRRDAVIREELPGEYNSW